MSNQSVLRAYVEDAPENMTDSQRKAAAELASGPRGNARPFQRAAAQSQSS